MAFSVGDIVKKIDGSQKYKVVDVLPDSKYKCIFEPKTSSTVSFVFKESVLQLA